MPIKTDAEKTKGENKGVASQLFTILFLTIDEPAISADLL
jgi:hypothetical protein